MDFNSIKEIFLSKEGIRASIMIVAGIIVACIGGKFITNFAVSDIVVILGSVVSLIGTQQICQYVVMLRNSHDDESEE